MSRRLRFRRLLLALLLIVLLCALVAVVLWRDWIASVLVVRAAYYLWLAGLVIRSRPQALYWALPIVVGIVTFFLVLARQIVIRRSPKTSSPAVGRVAEWAEWLKLASVTPYFNKYLHRQVARLAERALQLEQDPHAGCADESAPVGLPTLPAEVQALLSERSSALSRTISRREAENLQVIVDYLESVLEVDYDC